MLQHSGGSGHPERPERLAALLEQLEANPPTDRLRTPRLATRTELSRVHESAYVDAILGLEGESQQLDADTSVSPGSIPAALLAAGGAIGAVDAVLDGEHRHAFNLGRPPGHHAEAGHAMGFCLFNNVAVAAAHARDRGLERVLIIDWDVHHGNGTQHSFEADPSVVVMNLHQWPLYPGTGALTEIGTGEGVGATVNIPMPAGSGDGEYALASERLVAPIAAACRPELILISAGFDAHARDPLAQQELSTDGFARLAALVRDLADTLCDGRLVLTLEGGYDLVALTEGVDACRRVLEGEAAPEAPPPSDEGVAAVDAMFRFHRDRWGLEGSA